MVKMKYVYPAVFTYSIDEPDMPYSVLFPDIIPGVTCGVDFDNALYMAKDLLKLMLTTAPQQCFPPSTYSQIKKEYPDKRIVMVEVEIDEPMN